MTPTSWLDCAKTWPRRALQALARSPLDLALLVAAAVAVGSAGAASEETVVWLWRLFWAALALVLVRRVGPALLDNLHVLAARLGIKSHRAPERYVRALFEDYADTFEDHLLYELKYRAPNIIRGIVDRHIDPSGTDVLDAGCGTGLCGPLFREDARTLTGLDLAPAMLARAEAKGCYDQLIEGDLVTVLRRERARYDLILAADVLVYVGDLRAPLAALRGALRPTGHAAFTTEAVQDDRGPSKKSWDWRLGRTGRYEHGPAYVARLLQEAGFRVVASEPCVLRLQNGEDVEGRAWLAAAAEPARRPNR